jgi:murein DD-endopeptidase MepM/ murein hydrolase activator NlpD
LFKYSVPTYGVEPVAAAAHLWQGILADLPPEFNKDTWIAIWNEPNRNESDWMGHTAYEVGQLALRDGYKIAMFGFASGTPEYGHWFEPGMVKFLELAGHHRDQIAVCLHEYSFTTEYLLEEDPYYLVGRFQQLLHACDEQGLRHPTVIIKEFGWEYQDVPSPASAMPQLERAADLYAMYPTVLCANIWYLGGGFGNIAEQTQRLIAPVTNASLTYVPPDIPPPPNGEKTLYEFFWDLSIETQKISLNANAALQGEMFKDGRTPVGDEDWQVYPGNDVQYAYHAGEHPGGLLERGVYLAKVPEPGKPWVITSFTDPYDIPPPPGKIELEVFPTDYQTFTQAFGVNKHNYDMYCDRNGVCLQGHNGLDIVAPLGTPFYAAIGGTVTHASDRNLSGAQSGYGWHARIVTGDYTIIYAHAAPDLRVSVGDIVQPGQVIAVSGNTGNSTGPHLHFEMRKCPGLPDWPWCTIDPTPYIQPLLEPPPPVGVDMASYFQVVQSGHGPFFVLQHSHGPTENIQTHVPDGTIFLNKGGNGQYERMRVTASHIERREDTSHSGSTMYTLDDQDGSGWSKWAPRFWNAGDAFFRNPLVTVMDYDCNIRSQDRVPSWLVFDKFHPSWTSPPSDASPQGITFANVVEMSFRSEPDGEKHEIYKIAPNLGPYAEWWSSGGGHSWVSEIPQGREPLTSRIPSCLG